MSEELEYLEKLDMRLKSAFNRIFSDLHALRLELSAIKIELGGCGCSAEEYIDELKPHIHGIEDKLNKKA